MEPSNEQKLEEKYTNKEVSKGYMTTYYGHKFCPLNPAVSTIDLRDIAHSLSRICRWGGHVDEPFSVAQHSVLVSWFSPPKHQLLGLLHDASEAYLGDMIRPLKYLPELAIYSEIEKTVNIKIAEAFGLPSLEKNPDVELADLIVLSLEAKYHRRDKWDWVDKVLSENLSILPPTKLPVWSPEEAYVNFLAQYDMITRRKENLGW